MRSRTRVRRFARTSVINGIAPPPDSIWPRNGQATLAEAALPGLTEELFLAAGEMLDRAAKPQGLPSGQGRQLPYPKPRA